MLKTYVDYYHSFRPHQGLGNVTLPVAQECVEPEPLPPNAPLGEITCHEWLGGLLRHYERRAA